MPDIETTPDGVTITMSEDEYFEIAEIAADKIVKNFSVDEDKGVRMLAMLLVHKTIPAPPSEKGFGFEALARKSEELIMLEFGLTRLEEPKERN